MARTAVITSECVLSHPSLFEPRETPSGELKYGCALIFDKGADLAELRAAAQAAAVAKWAGKAAQMTESGALRMPFRDGAEREGSRGYGAGKTFLNASTKNQPGVVGRHGGPDGRPRPITDPAELYPGCRVRASLTAFAYDQAGNRGVSFALNNIQKLGEGPRLDGRKDAEDEFSAFPEDAPVDLAPDNADDGKLPTERLRRQVARRQLRRRLDVDVSDDDGASWGDAHVG